MPHKKVTFRFLHGVLALPSSAWPLLYGAWQLLSSDGGAICCIGFQWLLLHSPMLDTPMLLLHRLLHLLTDLLHRVRI